MPTSSPTLTLTLATLRSIPSPPPQLPSTPLSLYFYCQRENAKAKTKERNYSAFFLTPVLKAPLRELVISARPPPPPFPLTLSPLSPPPIHSPTPTEKASLNLLSLPSPSPHLTSPPSPRPAHGQLFSLCVLPFLPAVPTSDVCCIWSRYLFIPMEKDKLACKTKDKENKKNPSTRQEFSETQQQQAAPTGRNAFKKPPLATNSGPTPFCCGRDDSSVSNSKTSLAPWADSPTQSTPPPPLQYSDPTQLPSTPPFYPTSHGKKGTPQAPPQNTVISLNFLLPPPLSSSDPFSSLPFWTNQALSPWFVVRIIPITPPHQLPSTPHIPSSDAPI